MERQTGLFAFAVVLYALSLLEFSPAFVPLAVGSAQQPRSLRGSSGESSRQSSSVPLASRAALQSASTLLALGACALAARSRTQCRAKPAAEFEKGNPTLTFMNVLANAAAKKEESVAVTKDVMKVKKLYADEDFNNELLYVVNSNCTRMEEADALIKKFGDMDSVVFPKFVTYLAKKNRLHQLRLICKEYIADLYKTQMILPVVVTSAVKLTDDQTKSLKAKLKEKTGAADIKLITKVDGSLIAGFTADWGFTDPEVLTTPTEGIDLTLSSYLQKAKLKGVP